MTSSEIRKKLQSAKYKVLDDKSIFGEIPGLKGVWASAKNMKDCKRELGEVLTDWANLQIQDDKAVARLKINFDKKALLKNA